MKKVSILLIALMVIGVGVLSGCTDNQIENELDKFIGTWIYTGGSFYYDTVHLYSDGVLSAIYHDSYGDEGVDPGTWEANDTYLILHITNYVDVTFGYEFTSSDTLVLTASWGETGIYKKE